jgi:hypothetical protein
MNCGSPKAAHPVPPGMNSPIYRLLSSLIKAPATALAASTPNQMSLLMAYHVYCSKHLFLVNTLSFSHRSPPCLAVGASSPMLPSLYQLWTSYCRPAAWILSLQAGTHGPIPEDSLPFLVPQHRPPGPLHPGATLQGCNWVTACYAVSLVCGNTITGVWI